jgi:hypothetical protein
MKPTPAAKATLPAIAIVTALCAALLPVAAEAFVWFGSGQPERFFAEPRTITLQMLLASGPFWVTALLIPSGVLTHNRGRVRNGLAAGFALTLAMWAWTAWDGYTYQVDPGASGGANIGLGLVMLASPAMILLVMIVMIGRARAS